MNSNATAAVDNITQSSTADTLTVTALGQINEGDFFDGAGGTDIINLSYAPSGTANVDFRLATLNSYEGLTFLNATLLNSVSFNASQFGGTGLSNAFAVTGSAGLNTISIHNAGGFDASGFTFTNWTAGTDWMHFLGSSAADNMIGSLTGDKLEGGANNDTYVVNHLKDTVIEATGQGTDTVNSSVNHTLATNVEALVLTGTTSTTGTGNTLNNSITGNSGSNVIDGGLGADTMNGGDGNDTYHVSEIGDVITEGAGVNSGNDTVRSTITYSIAATNLENISLLGTLATNATGNTGNNSLSGNSNINTLTGGLGNDILDGGGNADSLVGGHGSDIYYVDHAGDTVTEINETGVDKVVSSVTFTLGTYSEDLTLSGTTAINGTGNATNNVMIGNSASNTLTGLGGNDSIDGGRGVDIMIGGLGNDTYAVDVLGETVTEDLNAGLDGVTSTVSFTLGANIENLTLVGAAAVTGTGNDLNNIIIGSSANNTLTGGNGNDTLDGGTGTDSLDGGAGNDTYVVDVASDSFAESAGNGTDLVKVGFNNYTLGLNLENLTLNSVSAVTGTGNAGSNVITGSTVANTIYGLAGNDTIDGSFGADAMHGGLDNDTYIVDNSGDTAIELASQGIDTVQASTSFTLGNHVENLTLTGSSVNSGTGNADANTIIGNIGSNILNGMAGNDSLSGGGGNDRLYGGAGVDSLTGGTGIDTFYFDTVSSSNSTDGIDTIMDFTTGDKINLNLLDADAVLAGNQNFVMDTDGLIAVGEVNVIALGGGQYGISISDDADNVIDMQIVVFSDHALTASDFIL